MIGLYRSHVLPRLVTALCGTSTLEPWRRRVVDGLRGTVVEIGFGSGLNVPFYGPEVEIVYAVEPEPVASRLARRRVAASPVEVRHVTGRGENLPLDDQSCDGALSTFTLCTVDDPEHTLIELRRVVRPGGRLHILEHGRSPDRRVAERQRRFEPVQRRLAGGCRLTRDPLGLVEQAGFRVEWAEARYLGVPRAMTWVTAATAVAPA